MAPRVFSPDEAWNDYGTWIINSGGFIHESLKFSPASNSPAIYWHSGLY